MPPSERVRNLVDHLVSENSIGVEIGVDKAPTSLCLLNKSKKLKHLYCVDPYIDREHLYQYVQKLLSQYDNCTLLKMTSHVASKEVPDNLDFVFIDGDHSYEVVLQDLHDWVPKLKSGGILMGHDWCRRIENAGVPRAGTEYFSNFEDLFEPLMSDEELTKRGLPYNVAGSGYIHKELNKRYPLWWRIKK